MSFSSTLYLLALKYQKWRGLHCFHFILTTDHHSHCSTTGQGVQDQQNWEHWRCLIFDYWHLRCCWSCPQISSVPPLFFRWNHCTNSSSPGNEWKTRTITGFPVPHLSFFTVFEQLLYLLYLVLQSIIDLLIRKENNEEKNAIQCSFSFQSSPHSLISHIHHHQFKYSIQQLSAAGTCRIGLSDFLVRIFVHSFL